jgi:hypothetical protein
VRVPGSLAIEELDAIPSPGKESSRYSWLRNGFWGSGPGPGPTSDLSQKNWNYFTPTDPSLLDPSQLLVREQLPRPGGRRWAVGVGRMYERAMAEGEPAQRLPRADAAALSWRHAEVHHAATHIVLSCRRRQAAAGVESQQAHKSMSS